MPAWNGTPKMNNYLPIVFLGVDGDIALGGTQASKASCMPNLRYCLTSFPTSKGEALLNQCNVDVAGTSVSSSLVSQAQIT